MGFHKQRQSALVAADNGGNSAELPSKKQQKAQMKAEKRNGAPETKLKRR